MAVRVPYLAPHNETDPHFVTTLALAQYSKLLSALKQFQDQHPQVQLVLKEQASALQQQSLLAETSDIAFLRPLLPLAPTLNRHLWANEDIMLALPHSHPLATETMINLSDFAQQPFIFSPVSTGAQHHQTLLDYCHAAGLTPHIAQKVVATHTILALAGSGFGVALLSSVFAQNHATHSNVVLKTIAPLANHTQPVPPLLVSWHQSNPNPLLAAFLKQLGITV